MAVESQVRRIEVKVAVDGDRSLKTLAKGFSDVNKNIKQSTSVMMGFKNAFLAIQGFTFAGIGVRELVQASDAMQKLNDRLVITEGGAAQAKQQLDNLTTTANANYTSIEDMATVYTRLNMALGDTGISSKELIGLTDTLVKTFRLSGASTAEATAATIQLSQGLASGQVRGQELRSVLEQNVVIGGLLAKQLGVTRGQLLKIAEKQGGISAIQVMRGLANGMEEVNTKAKNLKPTIQESITANVNTLKLKMAELNEEFGISSKAIEAINFAFSNLDLAAKILAGVVAYKAFTGAVAAATAAQLLFNKSVMTLVASPLLGFLVKIGVGAGAAAIGIAGLGVAALGAVAYWASLEGEMKKTNKTTEKTIGFQKSMTEQYNEEKKVLEQVQTLKQKQQLYNNQLSRSYVLLEDSANPLEQTFKETIDAMIEGTGVLSPFQKAFKEYTETAKDTSAIQLDFKASLSLLNAEFKKGMSLSEYTAKLKQLQIADLKKDLDDGTISVIDFNKKLKEIEFGKLKNNVKEFQFDLRSLNKEFGQSGDVLEYSRALADIEMNRLSADFKEGKINLFELNKGMSDIAIEEYNRQVAQGSLNFFEYNKQVNAVKIAELNNQFKAGKISAAEFHNEVIGISETFSPGSALYSGVNNYISSAGTLSQNIANGVTQTFGRLEDALVDFTETGKFNFREFTKGVLEDLNRIIIRSLIIRPLAQGILAGVSGGAGATGGAPTTYGGRSSEFSGLESAKGSAFDGTGARFFAKGGVVNGTTPFGYGGGKLGIMGEAGPEAILPLKRGANGDLGVKASPSNVVVNVINQSGAETEQRESTDSEGNRVIDILIVNKVKEGFAKGAFDKQMSQQYGLRRRGA